MTTTLRSKGSFYCCCSLLSPCNNSTITSTICSRHQSHNLDKITSAPDHIYDPSRELFDNLTWNELQWFSPLNNPLDARDNVMKRLMSLVSGVFRKDDLSSTRRMSLTCRHSIHTQVSVTGVVQLDRPGGRHDMKKDCPMGLVSCLVTPATITQHFMECHSECERMHISLMFVLQLMVKFRLLVPMHTQNTTTTFTTTTMTATQYLMPTLLFPASLLVPSVAQWTDQRSS